MIQDIYIIEDTNILSKELMKILNVENNGFKIRQINSNSIDIIFKEIPELILIDEDNISIPIERLCGEIRGNEDNNITPIIVYSSNEDREHKLKIAKCVVEIFIEKSMGIEYLARIVKNMLRLLSVNRTVSPLTGLPGNVQIQTELKRRLLKREPFRVLYFDLDNFKAYNDIYGFLKGDEIIKFTARTIIKYVHKIDDGETFVGHIGGDDFVAIIDGESDYDNICQCIIAEFDNEILKYFNDEDIEKGYLEVENRKGVIEEFPLTSLSIGVVVADRKRFSNILEIGEVGAQVKHLAKSTPGSCYAINRRDLEI